jgi:hypothetical protein
MEDEDNIYDEYVDMMTTLHPQMFSQPYGGFAVGRGWWPMLRVLCTEIQMHIDNVNSRRATLLQDNPHNFDIPDEIEQVTVQQIKEKFGTLSFYYSGGDERIHGLVQMAESMSGNICEDCGKPGKRRGGGWVRTLCDEHYQKSQVGKGEYNE